MTQEALTQTATGREFKFPTGPTGRPVADYELESLSTRSCK